MATKPKLPGLSKRAAASLRAAENRAVRASTKRRTTDAVKTDDSFQNFTLNLGMGTNNAMSGGTYGFSPITRQRVLLEWIHRGSWLGGVAIDLVADDMTRAKIDIQSTADPKKIEALQQAVTRLGIWGAKNECVKWGRLYGGCIGFHMIQGQDPATPLRIETVGKNQYKGILPLDRWVVEPQISTGNLIDTFGKDYGLPKFYKTMNMPGVPQMTIHHSRCFRVEGIKLPLNQRIMESMWGISVLERIHDRMVAFDSATAGAAQLAYKCYLRTIKIKQLRELVAAGGKGYRNLLAQVDMVSRFQSIEGLTLIDADDEMDASGFTNFPGLAEIIGQLGEQLSGALQIPLVRLFGQSPGGLNSTGDSDLRMYYDGIKEKQEQDMREDVDRTYRLVARSEGIDLGGDFNFEFRSLWQMNDEQQATVAAKDTESVLAAQERGLISPQTGLKELRQRGRGVNRWTNITDKEVSAADDEVKTPGLDDLMADVERNKLNGGGNAGSKGARPINVRGAKASERSPSPKMKDAMFTGELEHSSLPTKRIGGFDIVIESFKGYPRWIGGKPWPADYGYIRRTSSAEGADEKMDCMVGETPCDHVWVIDQFDGDRYDEAKVMFHMPEASEAVSTWHAGYDGTKLEMGGVKKMSFVELQEWLCSDTIMAPVSPRPNGKEASP